MTTDPRVSCPRCLVVEADRTWTRPGNVARPDMGHAMYFDATGRIAACLAHSRAMLSIAAAQMGRKGGAVRSQRKAAAVRLNGQLGGRPINPMTHRHRPVRSRDECWTGCVVRSERACDGIAHGNITRVDECRCGAVRKTEINQFRRAYGPWFGGVEIDRW